MASPEDMSDASVQLTPSHRLKRHRRHKSAHLNRQDADLVEEGDDRSLGQRAQAVDEVEGGEGTEDQCGEVNQYVNHNVQPSAAYAPDVQDEQPVTPTPYQTSFGGRSKGERNKRIQGWAEKVSNAAPTAKDTTSGVYEAQGAEQHGTADNQLSNSNAVDPAVSDQSSEDSVKSSEGGVPKINVRLVPGGEAAILNYRPDRTERRRRTATPEGGGSPDFHAHRYNNRVIRMVTTKAHRKRVRGKNIPDVLKRDYYHELDSEDEMFEVEAWRDLNPDLYLMPASDDGSHAPQLGSTTEGTPESTDIESGVGEPDSDYVDDGMSAGMPSPPPRKRRRTKSKPTPRSGRAKVDRGKGDTAVAGGARDQVLQPGQGYVSVSIAERQQAEMFVKLYGDEVGDDNDGNDSGSEDEGEDEDA